VEANFALDANAGSASPKGWQAAAKRGLIANNPFSRSKKEDAAKRLLLFCYQEPGVTGWRLKPVRRGDGRPDEPGLQSGGNLPPPIQFIKSPF